MRKNLNMKQIFKLIPLLFVILAFVPSCEKEPAQTGLSNIVSSAGEDKISHYKGTIVKVSFNAAGPWEYGLDFISGEGEWATVRKVNGNDAGGNGYVSLTFDENTTQQDREVQLWIKVEGYAKTTVSLVQGYSGSSSDEEMNKEINGYMHDILLSDYLWNEAYSGLSVDLSMDYNNFLNTYLLQLDDVNIEDGGYYKSASANAGERYIYSYIKEITDTKVDSYVNAYGLGFGPILSTAMDESANPVMGLALSYVRPNSPAAQAGMRRGDIIYSVNGNILSTSNYSSYMSSLYYSPSGSYTFEYMRFEPKILGEGYELKPYTATCAAGVYPYNPVLHASVMQKDSYKIGYLVLENFDYASQDFLEETVDQFKSQGINELILDLRFNIGGSVAQSRWFTSCIAGAAHGSDIFTNVVYNDESVEKWTFDYGPGDNDIDNLGKGTDLGLNRLYVIQSYNTASASELVITSLRGIDFPVYTYGGKSEGKNVGMTVSHKTYGARTFEFAPITFYVRNAKGFGDYADGIAPDHYVYDEDNDYDDGDADNIFPYSFGDWSNMDFNIALLWAYCDLVGEKRPGNNNIQIKSSDNAVRALRPVECTPMAIEPGRYGNLIMETER